MGGPGDTSPPVLPPASRRGARDGFGVPLRPDHDARIGSASCRAGPGVKRGGRARKDRRRVAGTSRRVAARTLARGRLETTAAARREAGRAASRGTVPGAGGARRWGFGAGLGARTPRRRLLAAATAGGLARPACLLRGTFLCARGRPLARMKLSTGVDLPLARVHACLSMLGAQRIGGVNGIFATSRCMCHCVRQDLISVQFYCTVTTAYLVTELSIIGTNLMVRSFPSSLLIMFLPYQQFC